MPSTFFRLPRVAAARREEQLGASTRRTVLALDSPRGLGPGPGVTNDSNFGAWGDASFSSPELVLLREALGLEPESTERRKEVIALRPACYSRGLLLYMQCDGKGRGAELTICAAAAACIAQHGGHMVGPRGMNLAVNPANNWTDFPGGWGR